MSWMVTFRSIGFAQAAALVSPGASEIPPTELRLHNLCKGSMTNPPNGGRLASCRAARFVFRIPTSGLLKTPTLAFGDSVFYSRCMLEGIIFADQPH